MGERIKPAPVGGKHRRQREVVHDAGKARRIIERAFGVGQSVVGRQQFVRSRAGRGSAGRAMRAGVSAQASPSAQRAALSARLSRNSAARRSGGRRRGKRHMVGVVGQTRSPNVWKWRNSLPFVSHARANGGLSECVEIWLS